MADFTKAFSAEDGISLGDDDVGIVHGDIDPITAAQAAPIGSLYLQTNNLRWRKTGGSDTDWTIIFGTEHHWADSVSISSTTSTSFQTKLTLATPSLLGGIYRVEVCYGWFLNSTNYDFEARVLLDGGQIGQLHKQEPKDNVGNAQRMYVNRKGFLNLSAGSHTLSLQFRTEGGFIAPASIFEATIEIWRAA